MAFPDGWGRKCAVVIDSAYVSGTSHADFPLLLTEDILPSEMFDADGSYPALNGGGDIRFSSDSAGSTQLACEVVSFVTDNDPANGTAEIWVSVPTLSGSTDTTIYVWYNKTGETQPAVTDTYGRNAVWVDYEAVLHLNTSGYVDSTGNSHTGSANGSPSQSTTGHPWGGTWTYLPGTIARISLASSSGMLNGGDGALQVWFRLASLGINDIGIFGDWTTTGATDRAQIIKRSPGTGNQHRVIWDDGTAVAVTGAALTTNTTYKSTFTWNSSTGYLYKNGASDGSASVSDGVFDSAQSFILGSYYDLASDRHLNGYVGEARARRSYLSSDWVATEYNNQSAPGTFAAAGTPEAVGGGAAYDETFSASASSAFTLADSWTLNYAETFGASADSGATFTDTYDTPSVNYDETFAASAASGTELTDEWSLDYSETFAAAAVSGATLTDAWALDYAETFAAASTAAFTLTDAWALDYAETFAASAASGCDLTHSYAVGNNYAETFAASSVSVATLTHAYSVQYAETFAAMALADCTLVAAWELDYAETFAAAAASGAVFTEAYETPAPGVFDETFSALAVSACDLTHAFSTPAAIGRVINPTLAARGAPMRTLKGLKLIN